MDIPCSGPVCKPRKELTRAIIFSASPMSPYGAWAELHSFGYHQNEASKCPEGGQSALYPNFLLVSGQSCVGYFGELEAGRLGGQEWEWECSRHPCVVCGRQPAFQLPLCYG